MASTYEQILRAEIEVADQRFFELVQQTEHLEAHLEGLKRALELWLANGQGAHETESARPAVAHAPRRRYRRRGSKFEEVLKFIGSCGEAGVTIEEMFGFATANGLKLKRTSIRSNVFNYKKSGALEKIGEGRYRKAAKSEPKVPENEEGPSGFAPSGPSLKVVGGA